MDARRRSARAVKIAGLSIDRKNNHRIAEIQKKSNDMLKRKYQATNETKSLSSEQGEVKKPKESIDALDKLIEDTIETNYGFGKHLQALEKEVSGCEENIKVIAKEKETLISEQEGLKIAISICREHENSKLQGLWQPLDSKKSEISAKVDEKEKQLQGLRKRREEKLSHIQKFNTERDKYRNQYKALLEVCKSHLAVKSPKESADKQLSEQKHEASQMKTRLSEQKALNISEPIFDEMAKKTHYAVEQTYGFNNRIHTLEQEKLREKEEHEQELRKLQQEEQKKLSDKEDFNTAISALSKLKSMKEMLDKVQKDSQSITAELEKYKKKKEELIHKFEVSQKKKEDRIQELNKEKNDCLKRYTDHIFGLYKSTFAMDNANKLANDQFKRDMLIASTTALSNMNFRSSNNLGELIKNILKSVLEGKL